MLGLGTIGAELALFGGGASVGFLVLLFSQVAAHEKENDTGRDGEGDERVHMLSSYWGFWGGDCGCPLDCELIGG